MGTRGWAEFIVVLRNHLVWYSSFSLTVSAASFKFLNPLGVSLSGSQSSGPPRAALALPAAPACLPSAQSDPGLLPDLGCPAGTWEALRRGKALWGEARFRQSLGVGDRTEEVTAIQELLALTPNL